MLVADMEVSFPLLVFVHLLWGFKLVMVLVDVSLKEAIVIVVIVINLHKHHNSQNDKQSIVHEHPNYQRDQIRKIHRHSIPTLVSGTLQYLFGAPDLYFF